MLISSGVAMAGHQRIALRFGEVGGHHLRYQIVEGYFGCSVQFRSGFGSVTQEGFDFGRAEVFGVDAHDWGADIRSALQDLPVPQLL